MGIGRSSLDRFERAEGPLAQGRVKELLGHYGVSDPEQVQTWTEAMEADLFVDYFPGVHMRLAACEEVASHIRAFAPHVVPSLVQTSEYAHALAAASVPSRDPGPPLWEVQRRLDKGDERAVLILLSEAVLHYLIGYPMVMARQWDHLQDLLDRQRADVRILPLASQVYRLPPLPLVEMTLRGRSDHYLFAECSTDLVCYVTGPERGASRYEILNEIEAACLSADDSYDLLDQARTEALR